MGLFAVVVSSLVLAGAGEHAWDRLHAALARRAGPDGVERLPVGPDVPLWRDSDYLLEPGRREELLRALDAAVSAPRPDDPLRAVLLQQALWAAHHWATDVPEGDALARAELAGALALTLTALAPSADELARLPDVLAAAEADASLASGPDPRAPRQPFLPPGLGSPDGPWVRLADGRARGAPPARAHAEVFGGRSDFEVLLSIAGGRDVTLAWLAALREREWTLSCRGRSCANPGAEDGAHLHLARDLPALPPGSAVALVRRALAVDERGELRVTALVLGVQVRAFLAVPEGVEWLPEEAEPPEGWPWQALCELELVLDRSTSPASARLQPVAADDDLHFAPLGAHGDPLRHPSRSRRAPLDSCIACHGAVGLASVIAFTDSSTGPGTQLELPLRRPPRRLEAASADEARAAALSFARTRIPWR